CLWAALRAFSATTPPVAQLLIGYATGYALTRRALPIGGAGIVEALLPFALGWVAIARAPAVLAVAAYRVFNLWLPLLPALTSIPKQRRLERRRVHKAAGQRIRQGKSRGAVCPVGRKGSGAAAPRLRPPLPLLTQRDGK